MSKAFEITGADGGSVAIPPAHYYLNTKARCRRLMLNSLSSDARRVYACIELATMGFRQELAVTMENGEKRPLTPGDIGQQTSLRKQDVRDALAELEDAGLIERRSDDGGPLRNRHILIYSWAEPRGAPVEGKGTRAQVPFPSWFPQSWEPFKPLIKRLKLSISIDEVSARGYFDDGAEVARTYEKAEKEVARFLERICARPKKPRINKEERNEIKKERKTLLPPSQSTAPEAPKRAESARSIQNKKKPTIHEYLAAELAKEEAKERTEAKAQQNGKAATRA